MILWFWVFPVCNISSRSAPAWVLQEQVVLWWVPHTSQCLWETLLLRGLLSISQSYCWEPISVWAFYGLQLLSERIFECGAVWSMWSGCLICHGLPLVSRGQSMSPWSSPWAAGQYLLQHLEHFIPLLPPPWCLQGCFPHFLIPLSQLMLKQHFLPFLKYVTIETLSTSLMDWALTGGRPVLLLMKLALMGMEASGACSQKLLQKPSAKPNVAFTKKTMCGKIGKCLKSKDTDFYCK